MRSPFMSRPGVCAIRIMFTFLMLPCWAAKPNAEAEKQVAAEEQFMTALKSGKHDRWSTLPDWVKRVYVSPSGIAWFEADQISGTITEKGMMESVERAAAG